ncbi:MAG: YidC/Oxa1 family insertase periplasmic-domain containing protein, partial [Bacteroidales bacterium]|nr:YidC/Oxa1 family insertase periplasmic-domain containing protein [Bacteroidales bacterium]
MRRQTVTGFALIGIILLVFSWYNTKQYEKQVEAQKHVRDSIAAVEADRMAEADALADSLGFENAQQMHAALDSAETQMYMSSTLNAAASDSIPEQVVYLENDKLKVGISTLGAAVSEVEVKNYFKYDSTALNLAEKGTFKFDVELDAGQWINTADFNYTLVSASETGVAMRLYVDESSYIENIYTLAPDSYQVDFKMHFVGMNDNIPRSSSQFSIDWMMDVPRLEKGYENEKNYSSVAFHYTGSDDIKHISMRRDGGSESLAGSTEWIAYKQQFFSAILISEEGMASGEVSSRVYPDNDPARRLMCGSSHINMDFGEKSADFSKNFQFVFTPNHYPTLKSFDRKFDKLLPLGGWLTGTISKYVIIPLFNWMRKSIANYGIIILLMTLLIKLVISPMTLSSYVSSAKMRVLKPEIEKINARYPKQEDAMKKQQATMELYKKTGVSMWGGCLPALIQMPILFAMFRFFPSSFELRQQSFLWA